MKIYNCGHMVRKYELPLTQNVLKYVLILGNKMHSIEQNWVINECAKLGLQSLV